MHSAARQSIDCTKVLATCILACSLWGGGKAHAQQALPEPDSHAQAVQAAVVNAVEAAWADTSAALDAADFSALEAQAQASGQQIQEFARGGASWYGSRFHKRRTASGERFDMNALTAAHPSLPFGTLVCVHSLVNGREVLVRINDRGPHAKDRIIDLSQGAARVLDMLGRGSKQVALYLLGQTDSACADTSGKP